MSNGKIVVSRTEDSPATPFPWGEIRWMFHRHLATDAEMTFGVVTIRKGQSNPTHSHPNCEELLYLMKGELDHYVNGETCRLTPGMMIRLPRDSIPPPYESAVFPDTVLRSMVTTVVPDVSP